MANRRRRRRKLTLPSLFILLILMLGYFMYTYFPDIMDNTGEKAIPDGILEVHVIDVGQGDCTLFRTENECLLFDAGTNSSEDELKAYLDNLGIEKINYAIFTHPHEDHIGGADMIINNYDVEKAIIPDVDSDTITYNSMIDALEDKQVEVYMAVSGDEYTVGDINMTILAPNSEKYGKLNDYSIVAKLEYGNNSFMLTGDAETGSEEEILKKYTNSKIKCDFLKVGHHGSDTSTSQAFLNAVDPSIATISCGKDNKHGHPNAEILDKLNNGKITYYRTDELGSIVFECDGTKITKK